jgi:hypothetical protein
MVQANDNYLSPASVKQNEFFVKLFKFRHNC